MNTRTQNSTVRLAILNTIDYGMQILSLITLLQMKHQIRMESNPWIVLEGKLFLWKCELKIDYIINDIRTWNLTGITDGIRHELVSARISHTILSIKLLLLLVII
jgi:hypothetical protein